MTSSTPEDLRDARTAFQDLLLLGGAAAANADSLTHRGSYATSAERWGLEYWANYLGDREVALARTIIAAIIALSLSTDDRQRMSMAAALRGVVHAARTPSAPRATRPKAIEPRRYWLESER